MKMVTFVAGTTASAAMMAFLLMPDINHAAPDPGESASAGKSSAVTLTSVPGSNVKRITLTARAAERLGIETGKVGEESITRKQMVGGLIVQPFDPEPRQVSSLFGGFGGGVATVAAAAPALRPAAPAPDETWVLVTLSRTEWEELATDKPARILPLATRENFKQEILARPSAIPPIEDMKRSLLALHYVVPGKDHGLTLNKRVRVELQQAGGGDKQKVVPYGAVYYDATGLAWVYVTTGPLTFERQPIVIERVDGDLALLTSGPPIGTPVVTTGAAMLYGTEVFGK